ncbi:MAG: hypothetical protein J5I47_01665 [Vicingus serpentipes]|nr:hypothetical protein [Vicingus serpentipes]
MKYRCLSDEELQELEEEFKHFLISNNIFTEEWEGLNKKKDKKVKQLVEMFSDIVMEKALKNIQFLEYITPSDIRVFHCLADRVVLIGVESRDNTVDFTTQHMEELQAVPLDIYRTEKPYVKSRELEVFDLLQSGCFIIGEDRFKKLELAYTYSTKQSQN